MRNEALSFRFHVPTEVLFGLGVRSRIGEIAERWSGKGVLVADAAVRNGPLWEAFIEPLRPRIAAEFGDVEPNPSVATTEKLAALLRDTKAAFLIAVGGGSVLDAAKAAALAAGSEHSVLDLHSGRAPVPASSLPLVAVPTTAGTGSEVTGVAVLTDVERNVKAPLGGPALYPRVALVDPEWTLKVPPSVTAATGLDALSHALEAYWSIHASPLTDALAIEAARLVLEGLPVAFSNGQNKNAREKTMLGSLLAGFAFSQAKTAGVHACSYPLTQRFGLPHGVACALTLDAFLRFNNEAIPERLSRLAQSLGQTTVDGLADRISLLKRSMGLPMSLAEAGIPMSDLGILTAESFHPNMKNNPREMTPELLRSLYLSLG